MREETGFGIVLLKQGSEGYKTGEKFEFHKIGMYCKVVDWEQLPNNLLGVTVEGEKKLMVENHWQQY